MHVDVELPDMGDDAGDEATVVEWYVKEGDDVEEGEVLMEVGADGACYDVPAPTAGTVLDLLVDEEDIVHVGDVVAVLDSRDAELPITPDLFDEEA